MKTVIIGGGPSGMMAATEAQKYSDVEIIERNEKLGKKLFITGKGRCNITNLKPIDTFFSNIPNNPKFLYNAFNQFNNQDLINFLNSHHLKTKVEQGQRVYPLSDKSSDVIKLFEKLLSPKVNISLNERVLDINYENEIIIETDKRRLITDKLIIATGGASYPQTGSTGDGYNFLRKYGINIIKPKPSLVPILLHDEWVYNLSGVSLKNVSLSLYEEGKKKEIFQDIGELLFTHKGISGPLALTASSLIKIDKNYKLYIDLKPGLSLKELENRIIRDLETNINSDLENALLKITIKRLLPEIFILSEVDGKKKANQITKSERRALCNTIKNIPLSYKGLGDFKEAIITSGGVDVKEINPKTMELKKLRGVFVAGEIIDVDAFTGGYNLQIAFSTGYVAGRNE